MWAKVRWEIIVVVVQPVNWSKTGAHQSPLCLWDFQARKLKWLPFPSQGTFSARRDQTCLALVGKFFTAEPPGKRSRGTASVYSEGRKYC